MAEQDAGRSELPTQHKLDEARKKGSVVHSADVGALGILVGFVVVLISASGDLIESIRVAFRFCFGPGLSASPFEAMQAVFTNMIQAAILPVCILLAFALFTAAIQHPLLFSTQPLKPDWKKINPAEGLKRLFSLKSLFMLGMAILKIIVLGVISYTILRNYLPDVVSAMGHPSALWNLLDSLTWALIGTLLLAFAIFAALEFTMNRRFYIKQLMMSPRDIKDESKRREGDPLIKRRIREYRMEMLKKMRSLGAVPGADFVVTNPTHYAVAIKYNPQVLDAPVVVSKGGGGLAFRIRSIARRHQVPMYERKRLTRALFFNTAVGQPVPVEFYRDIALLLKQARAKRRKK